MEQLLFSSVETLPHARASVAFTELKPVFKEDDEITPTILSDTHSYMPWGATNQMPFDIIDLIESDETLATCQMFNAEVCYGSGLVYACTKASAPVKGEVADFTLDNDLASYFLGVCQDFKHFAFAVSVIILNAEGTKIVRLVRKEACYCRFAPADKHGKIPRLYFANWRKFATLEDCEVIEMLDTAAPFCDLRERLANGDKCRKFAIVSRVPTPNSTYYTILCRAISRQVVQHQAAHRSCKRSQTQKLRADKVPHRGVAEVLGLDIQVGGHNRPLKTASAYCGGEAAHPRLPYRCREQRQGVVLNILRQPQRR